MGRHQSNTVDYFPHMAKQGKTLFILKARFGSTGYAFWFQLLEALCSSEDHYYDCRDGSSWLYLLSATGVDEISGTEMLDVLSKLRKIDADLWNQRIIWCPQLVKNLEEVYKKRGRPVPQRPLVDPKSTIQPGISVTEKPVSVTDIPQSKVKESKVKESKESVCPYQDIIDLWKEIVPSLPKPQSPIDSSSTRAKDIRARWQAAPDLKEFRMVFEAVEASDFLSGRNGKWTSCNIDWVMQPRNWLKVEEGNYVNKEASHGDGQGRRHYAGLPGNRPSGAFDNLANRDEDV